MLIREEGRQCDLQQFPSVAKRDKESGRRRTELGQGEWEQTVKQIAREESEKEIERHFPYSTSTNWSKFCTFHKLCFSSHPSLNPDRHLKKDQQFV